MKRLSRAERRAQLLRLAILEFGAKGYDAASLTGIADAAGVRKQTLLYYFASKEALFDACVEQLANELKRVLEDALARPEQGWERVEAVIRAVFRFAEGRSELMSLVREVARHSPDSARRIAAELEGLRKRALGFLEAGMEEGLFRIQDPGFLLFTLYTAIVGSITEAGVLSAVTGKPVGRRTLKRRERELIEFVRRALLP